ncbi:hypothetical protein K435DRAFT_969333 [Dendrothele bispora CBS 962.96]|uniref:BTB domain-containing protein n=1 Tax=Dendrothele bispora (strain CBS 962.96) TaxID=1314807 RepID=A0A4S8LI62_DENBC|nr:hypothetical protein K435DRAFT_969333 [Dendrothele bispora CBS 962.96]
MKILPPTTIITATVSATTTPTTVSSSQPPQSQQSQPFPLSPRLPSSQLHESLIMSKDGTIRAAPEVEPSESKVGEDESGDEVVDDEVFNRMLAEISSSLNPGPRNGNSNSLKRRRAFISSDTDMSGDDPRSTKTYDSDSSSVLSLPSNKVARSYQKRQSKDREGPSHEQEQAQTHHDEPSLPVAKRQKLCSSTARLRSRPVKGFSSTRTPANKTKRRNEGPSLEQEIPQATHPFTMSSSHATTDTSFVGRLINGHSQHFFGTVNALRLRYSDMARRLTNKKSMTEGDRNFVEVHLGFIRNFDYSLRQNAANFPSWALEARDMCLNAVISAFPRSRNASARARRPDLNFDWLLISHRLPGGWDPERAFPAFTFKNIPLYADEVAEPSQSVIDATDAGGSTSAAPAVLSAQAHHDERVAGPSLPVTKRPKSNSSTAKPRPRLISAISPASKSEGISGLGSTRTPANKAKAKASGSGPGSSTQTSTSTPNPSAGKASSRRPSIVTQSQVQKRLYKRHYTHWTLDGNVIIRISNVQYKLVRSVLAKQSRWFQSAFDTSINEGEDENGNESGKEDEDERRGKGMEPVEQYNGCPVYVLDGIVRLRDFERLLDAMDAVVTYVHDPPPFPVLASIIRASTALEFTHFKRYSRRILEEKWKVPSILRHSPPDSSNHSRSGSGFADPADGDDQDNGQGGPSQQGEHSKAGLEPGQGPGADDGSTVDADDDDDDVQEIDLESFRKRISYPRTTILLSRDCHIPSVLPRAMYELMKTNELDLHGILCGLDEADESEDDRDNDEGKDRDEDEDEEQEDEDKDMNTHRQRQGRPKLSQKLLFRLIQAREELATLWMREISVPPSVEHVEPDKASNGDRAKTVSSCLAKDLGQDMKNWHWNVLTSWESEEGESQDPIFVQYRYDFVCGLGEIIDIDWEGEGYCDACAAKRRKAWREMMRRWWKIFEEIVQN